MPTIDLQHNYDLKAAELTTLERKQLPFAFALACTNTARRGQTKVRRNLPRRFTIRNKWVQGGIRIVPAKKTDATPMATVFSRDDYMYLHEEGGTKRPEEGKALAVPVNIVQRGRIVGRHLRPSTILEKPGYFVAPIKSGSKTGGLFRRVGAKSRTTWTKNRRSGAKVSTTKALRQHIELLYVFTPQAKVAPRFGFEQLVMSAVNRYFPSEFDGALDYALRTSRY